MLAWQVHGDMGPAGCGQCGSNKRRENELVRHIKHGLFYDGLSAFLNIMQDVVLVVGTLLSCYPNDPCCYS